MGPSEYRFVALRDLNTIPIISSSEAEDSFSRGATLQQGLTDGCTCPHLPTPPPCTTQPPWGLFPSKACKDRDNFKSITEITATKGF